MSALATIQPLSKPFFVSAPLARIAQKCTAMNLEKAADHINEIAPGHSFFHPKAIFDERDVERITATAQSSTIKNEIARARGGKAYYRGPKAFTFNDVLVHRGTFYRGWFRHPVGLDRGPAFNVSSAECVKGGVLAQSWLGSKYFGHAIHEEIPLALLGQERGNLVSIGRETTEQTANYQALFSINARVLPFSAWLDSLEIISDDAYSLSKIGRWQKMRQVFSTTAGNAEHPGVFIMRGDTGQARKLVNEEELANHFIKLGFKVINPGHSTLREILSAVGGARVVVGVEGSQLVHGLLGLAQKGSMMVIQPPNRFDNAHKEPCDLLGLEYAFLVAHPAEEGFSISTDEIDRGLDRLQKNPAYR